MKKYFWMVLIIWLFTLTPGYCWQFSNAFSKKSDSEENERPKFQMEFYGGFAQMEPEDLNLRNNFATHYQQYWNEDFLLYTANMGYIKAIDHQQQGAFKMIKQAFPLGFRLNYYLLEAVSLSLGYKYVSRSQSSNVKYKYNYDLNDGTEIIFINKYAPQIISTTAYMPLFGVHVEQEIAHALGIEAYVTGGPLFGECSYEYDLTYFEGQPADAADLNASYQQNVTVKGRGTGLAFDGGIRINYHFLNNFTLFLEGGYAYQEVRKISGQGKSSAGGNVREWEDDWVMINYKHSHLWGSIDTLYPTNSYDDSSNTVRYFHLDLSGFQVRIGIGSKF